MLSAGIGDQRPKGREFYVRLRGFSDSAHDSAGLADTFREQLRRGIDVAICHPKILETEFDVLDLSNILFHETNYSLHTLRESSRRS